MSSGAALAWTADLLGRPTSARSDRRSPRRCRTADGVTLVPAFAGLGAPHWDREARAALIRDEQSNDRAHIARAAVDAVAHQICDIVDEIRAADRRAAAPARRRRRDRLRPGDADPGRPARPPGRGRRRPRGLRPRRGRAGPSGGSAPLPTVRSTGRVFHPTIDDVARAPLDGILWREQVRWLRSAPRPRTPRSRRRPRPDG